MCVKIFCDFRAIEIIDEDIKLFSLILNKSKNYIQTFVMILNSKVLQILNYSISKGNDTETVILSINNDEPK